MRRPIKPSWLLRLARELAGDEAGRGQPRNSDLRRATSTAYYALFHAIAMAVAAESLPNATEPERHGFARYVTHASIKQVCAWISGAQPPLHLHDVVARLRCNTRLSDVASAFVLLQEQREAADYDHTADFTRPVSVAHVQRARGAVVIVQEDRELDEIRAFLGLIALRTAIGK